MVNAVAADGKHLYAVGWHNVNKGFVVRVPLAGGEVESLSKEDGAPKIVVLHDGHVYWDDAYSLKRLAVGGGAPETILAEGRGDAAMAVDDRWVYYVSGVGSPQGTPQLLRRPVGGGVAEVWVPDVGATKLEVSGEWVYWADGEGVSRVHATDRRVEKLADGPAEDLALDGDFVYFCRKRAALHRVPKSGGTDEKLDLGCGRNLLVVDGVSHWTDTTYGEGATHLSVGVVWRHAPGRTREEIYKGDIVSNLAAVGGHVYLGAGIKLLRL